MIHLEGMGVVGGILAWHLYRQGTSFTWHDVDAPMTAWKACTGVVYPSGDIFDSKNYDTWSLWASRAPWMPEIDSSVETTGWWYCTKAPPHGAKFRPHEVGVLRRAPLAAYHLNAQSFVPKTRNFFASRRVDCRPKRAGKYVVTHGFGTRLDHVLWGWTRRVRIELAPELRAVETYPRSSIYLREGRFIMAYAYAVPGEPWWYSGSSLIVQKSARSLDIEPKYERWKKNFLRLAGGLVNIVEEGNFTEGWRPAAAKGDDQLVRWIGDELHLKPLWSSGVRHSPLVVEAAMQQLRARS